MFPTLLFAQLPPHLDGKMYYPIFDFHPFVGVVKTEASALKYNKKLDYKIAIDIIDAISDSSKFMNTLRELGRTYNLNIANGVPQNKLKVAVVIHGGAIHGLLNNEAYQAKFGLPNPNIEIIQKMKNVGIDFYVCAQILAFRRVPEENIIKEVELAVSAKTALITLDQMGYTYMKLSDN